MSSVTLPFLFVPVIDTASLLWDLVWVGSESPPTPLCLTEGHRSVSRVELRPGPVARISTHVVPGPCKGVLSGSMLASLFP